MELGRGRGVKYEGSIISQFLYDSFGCSKKFIPIITNEDDIKNIPIPLRKYSAFLMYSEYSLLIRLVTNTPQNIPPPIGEQVNLKENTEIHIKNQINMIIKDISGEDIYLLPVVKLKEYLDFLYSIKDGDFLNVACFLWLVIYYEGDFEVMPSREIYEMERDRRLHTNSINNSHKILFSEINIASSKAKIIYSKLKSL